MLMMMRADDSYSPDTTEGCTAEELLACITADDYDACIAACSDVEEPEEPTDPEEVKAGTLNVTMTSEKGGDLPNLVSSLPVATYTLKAVDEDINVTSIVVKQGGYGSATTISGAALFINWARVSKVKDLDLSKEVTINLTNAYTVKAGKSVDVELRVSNNDALLATDQFTVEIVDVNSSAEKVKLPTNTVSNIFKFVGTPTATLTVTGTSALENPKAWTKAAELFEIKLNQTAWENQDIKVNSLTLLANNKDLADYLENIELVLDNDVLADGTMNGKYLTFVLSDPYVLEKNKTATLTVRADVIWWAWETTPFGFSLEEAMDLSATATSYDAPVHVDGTFVFSTFSVKAWRVTIERENPTTTTFTKNRKNVYLGSFTIKNNAGWELFLQDFSLDITWNVEVIDTVKVRYGSTSAGLIELNNAYADDTETSIGSKLTAYLYADILDTWVDNKNFKVSLNTITIADGDDNALTGSDISMPASWLQMKWTASALNVTKVNLADKSFAKWTEDIDAVSFKVKTNNVDWVKVKKLTFTSDTPVDTNTVRAAKLYVWDEEYSATVQNGTIRVTNTINLAVNTTTTFTLKVSLASNPTVTWGFTYSLTNIEAEDTSADRNDLTSDYTIAWRKISVAENWSLSVTMENTADNKYAKSILAWTDAVIAEYQLKTTYEDINVDEIELTFSAWIDARVSNIELTYGDTVISNPLISWTKATFENADLDVTTTKTPLTVKLITKEINSDNGTGILKNVTLDQISFTGLVWNETWNPITSAAGWASKKFDIVPATIVATVTSSSNTQTKLNLFVNKWNNEDADGNDIKVYVQNITWDITNPSSALLWLSLHMNWVKLAETDLTNWALGWAATYDDFLLSAWDNEITINYYVSWAIQNPSYVVDLTNVMYVADINWEVTDIDTLTWADHIFNRQQGVLNLVTR